MNNPSMSMYSLFHKHNVHIGCLTKHEPLKTNAVEKPQISDHYCGSTRFLSSPLRNTLG